MDSIGILMSGDWSSFTDPIWAILFGILITVTVFVHFRTGNAIKNNKSCRLVPIISVNSELLILFFFVKYLPHSAQLNIMPIDQTLIVFSFIVILLNLLGAMRANKGIIIHQTIFLTGMMSYAFLTLPERSLFAFYIPTLILISGVFSLWIADMLMNSFVINEELNTSNEEIKEANEEITQQNDEIKNANEEIRQQNEEITVQRDQLERQHGMVLQHNKNITDSMRYAFRIQKAVFPEEEFMKENLPEHFIINKPKEIVSGDFYWIHRHKSKLYIAVADCTGHGVPGAFMSMLGSNMLSDVLSSYVSEDRAEPLTPAYILDEVREKVKSALHQTGRIFEMKDGMDMAIVSIDKYTNEMEFAGANNPVIILRNQELFHLKPDRMPVAIHRRERPFENKTFQLEKNDSIYLFSDGYPDQFGGEEGQKLLIKRFKAKLQEISTFRMEEQHKILDKYFTDWRGEHEQVDDVLVMGIRMH